MVTLSADYYCGTLSLWQPFFAKGLGYFAKHCPSAWKCQTSYTQLDSCFGCMSDRFWISLNLVPSVLSVTESLRTTWLASDCSRCWCEAGYHLLTTNIRQQYLYPWYHCGANAEMIVVNMLRSDVYHVLHMCHVLIKVTITFWLESVCYLIFWKFFVYTLQSEQVNSWTLGVLNGGVSVSFVDNFYNELFILVVTFTLLCPQNIVTCLT